MNQRQKDTIRSLTSNHYRDAQWLSGDSRIVVSEIEELPCNRVILTVTSEHESLYSLNECHMYMIGPRGGIRKSDRIY